jgi:cytochrome P450
LAGHETTAIALTYAIYSISKHPEIEARWRDELLRVLGGRVPSADDVPLLELTSRIIKETMRLYPPVWAIGRETLRDTEFRGCRIPRGAQLTACQWIVHRDPRWFPDPEAFDPDRWSEARSKQLHRFAYFPFGGGPRVCIGNHFALMEAALLLALFGQRFHFELLPGTRLELLPSVTLRPKHPIRMRLHEVGRPSASEAEHRAAAS